jgi:Cu+-exporting ATPase
VEVAIDPVCGMEVDVSTARHRAEHAGNVYLFCAAGCQRHFEADPGKFLAEPHPADPPPGKSGCR